MDEQRKPGRTQGRLPATRLRPALLAATVVLAGLYVFGGPKPRFVPTHPYAETSETPAREIVPGVTFREVHLAGGHDARTLWIYMPKRVPAGRMPCVFIAPSGTTGFYGKRLFENDRKEHVPYVKRGFAVVAYSIDGAADDFYAEQIQNGIVQFRSANCGVDNSQAAIDYALQHLPQIDPTRLYTAGHSSGGTMALMAAEHDTRIAGCIAYAPACDITRRIDPGTLKELSNGVVGLPEFLVAASPTKYTRSLTSPVFLFHADDDAQVTTSDVESFMTKLKQTNGNVTYVRVVTGGHYSSMLDVGIPRGIVWLQALDRRVQRG